MASGMGWGGGSDSAGKLLVAGKEAERKLKNRRENHEVLDT
jgi:hypothetical protein